MTAIIVQRHEARRLERTRRLRPAVLTGHARVQAREERHDRHERGEAVHETDPAAEPPGRPPPAFEGERVA